MTQKDWILLMVPILCNGVVVFILQKVFEKRQLAISAKQKYVSVLQGKIDVALTLFMNVVQTSGKDLVQINYLNQFSKSFTDVHYYYQQNMTLFKAIRKDMDKAFEVYKEVQRIQLKMTEEESNLAYRVQLENLFRTLYTILQKVQNKCINYKI